MQLQFLGFDGEEKLFAIGFCVVCKHLLTTVHSVVPCIHTYTKQCAKYSFAMACHDHTFEPWFLSALVATDLGCFGLGCVGVHRRQGSGLFYLMTANLCHECVSPVFFFLCV